MTRKRLTYYRRYMRDFEDGCHGLSWEQRGFYVAVVDEIYLTGGPAMIDWRVFAKRASSNAALAKRLLSELVKLGKLYVTDDGQIGNPRADKEIRGAKKAIEKSDKVLAKHLPKHLPKESLKTQQKLRAGETRTHPSTNIYKSSMLVPSFAAPNGNDTPGSPRSEDLTPEDIAAIKQRLIWAH